MKTWLPGSWVVLSEWLDSFVLPVQLSCQASTWSWHGRGSGQEFKWLLWSSKEVKYGTRSFSS